MINIFAFTVTAVEQTLVMQDVWIEDVNNIGRMNYYCCVSNKLNFMFCIRMIRGQQVDNQAEYRAQEHSDAAIGRASRAKRRALRGSR